MFKLTDCLLSILWAQRIFFVTVSHHWLSDQKPWITKKNWIQIDFDTKITIKSTIPNSLLFFFCNTNTKHCCHSKHFFIQYENYEFLSKTSFCLSLFVIFTSYSIYPEHKHICAQIKYIPSILWRYIDTCVRVLHIVSITYSQRLLYCNSYWVLFCRE